MSRTVRARLRRLLAAGAAVALGAVALGALMLPTPALAQSYVPVSGAGSTWSQNAIDQWTKNVRQFGIVVNYQGTGSSDGRNQFKSGTVDFGVSEIPYGLTDGGVKDFPPTRPYAYMPIVAGGTSFMYNLKIGNSRVTNLRLSGQVLAKIFTGVITNWGDPAIKADNPGLTLPPLKIVPVVRSDGSGTTAQFTTWMADQYPALWNAYCQRAGRATPCGFTSIYPIATGMGFTAQAGSLGVAGYVSQAQNLGTITYVEYSYALNTGFPVVKVLNQAGYYTEPTASNVAVGLLKAQINTDASSSDYLTQKLHQVYVDTDRRTYPLSSYSYMIVPIDTSGTFSTDKGRTLGAFAYYFLCEGQQQAPVLGYSPLPINLVQAGLDQVRRIPGVNVQSIDISKCDNPTFSANGTNTLAAHAPYPQDCDRQGPQQCGTGTGGASRVPTPVHTPSTPGVTPSGPAAPVPSGGAIDPDTGQVIAGGVVGGGGTGGDIVAVPVSVDANSGSGTTTTLMLIAGLLLILLTVGPPLLSRALGRRSGR